MDQLDPLRDNFQREALVEYFRTYGIKIHNKEEDIFTAEEREIKTKTNGKKSYYEKEVSLVHEWSYKRSKLVKFAAYEYKAHGLHRVRNVYFDYLIRLEVATDFSKDYRFQLPGPERQWVVLSGNSVSIHRSVEYTTVGPLECNDDVSTRHDLRFIVLRDPVEMAALRKLQLLQVS